MKIGQDKIGALIGPGGKNIRSLQEETGTKIDVRYGDFQAVRENEYQAEDALTHDVLEHLARAAGDDPHVGIVLRRIQHRVELPEGAFVDDGAAEVRQVRDVAHRQRRTSGDAERRLRARFRRGDVVRIRLANDRHTLHPMQHPIHIHGTAFEVTGTDSGWIPQSARYRETSMLVPVGNIRVGEFIADAPGDWAIHCHKSHHTMNAMGHGIPNPLGVKQQDIAREIRELMPGYMAMGERGMAELRETVAVLHAAGIGVILDQRASTPLVSVMEPPSFKYFWPTSASCTSPASTFRRCSARASSERSWIA